MRVTGSSRRERGTRIRREIEMSTGETREIRDSLEDGRAKREKGENGMRYDLVISEIQREIKRQKCYRRS